VDSRRIAVINALEILIDRREGTYVAAFLSCWLCIFALSEDEKRFIRLATFKVASNITVGYNIALQCQCWQAFIVA